MATIEIRKDRNGQFRFNVKGRNGEIIATSESYRAKAKAQATIKLIQTGLAKARVVDLTVEAASSAQAGASKASSAKGKSAKTAKAAKPGRAAKSAKAAKPAARSTRKASAKAGKKTTGKGASAGGGGKAAKQAAKSGAARAHTVKPGKAASSKSASPSARSSRPAASGGVNGGGRGVSPDGSDAPRSFNPTRIAAASPAPVIDDERDDADRNDTDVIPGREGADIVTPRELGDGEQISSDVDNGGGEDDDLVDENL